MSDVGTATETEPFSVTEAMNSMSDADKKSLKSWYFFDWANQAYALTVMTVIAPQVMSGLYNYVGQAFSKETNLQQSCRASNALRFRARLPLFLHQEPVSALHESDRCHRC